MTTNNIQDVVAERVEEFEKRFGSFTFDNGGALDFTLWDVVDERVHQTDEVGVVMQDWLTTTLTQLVKEVEAGAYQRGYKQGKFDGAMDTLHPTHAMHEPNLHAKHTG